MAYGLREAAAHVGGDGAPVREVQFEGFGVLAPLEGESS